MAKGSAAFTRSSFSLMVSMFQGLMVGTPQPPFLARTWAAPCITAGLVPSPVKAAMPAWAQAGTRQFPHHALGVPGHRFAGILRKSAGGSIAFPAAVTAAVALASTLYNHGMAHLASGKVEAAQNLAAQDNAAANAGTQARPTGTKYRT